MVKMKMRRPTTTMIDLRSLLILSFLIVFLVLAAIISMGAIPKIFQTATNVNQTNTLLEHRVALTEQREHEDKARQNQTLHEDLAREKQNEKENLARDKQRYQIVNETNTGLHNLERNVKDFISESENRSKIGATERGEILNKLKIALDNQEAQLSMQDSQIMLLHGQQDAINNITKETLEVLNKFGKGNRQLGVDNKVLLENLTKNIQEIKNILIIGR
jgi:hypothetical protein